MLFSPSLKLNSNSISSPNQKKSAVEMINILDFKIENLPDTAFYIPNFISTEDETVLLDKIYSSPKPKWKTLSNRRLQNWGGLPHPKGMIQENLPEWLNYCIQKVSKLEIFGEKVPNHVLVNEYLPGQGIMPHEDGPLFYPTIATINLGSHTILDYYEKANDFENSEQKTLGLDNRYIGSLLLERCSLLVVQEDLYHKYLHGIKEKESDIIDNDVKNLKFCQCNMGNILNREKRISLTIRHVPKTIKGNLLFKTR